MSEIGEGEIGLHPQPKVKIRSPFQERETGLLKVAKQTMNFYRILK